MPLDKAIYQEFEAVVGAEKHLQRSAHHAGLL